MPSSRVKLERCEDEAHADLHARIVSTSQELGLSPGNPTGPKHDRAVDASRGWPVPTSSATGNDSFMIRRRAASNDCARSVRCRMSSRYPSAEMALDSDASKGFRS